MSMLSDIEQWDGNGMITPMPTTKPTRWSRLMAEYWLSRDEARVSWAALRRAIREQRGKYAAWVTAGDAPQACDQPCCQAVPLNQRVVGQSDGNGTSAGTK